MSSPFSRMLELKFPLVVAPMAGGPSSPTLVTAASEAGALGSIGAAYSTPKAIRDFAAQVRARTTKPFAINLFVPTPTPLVKPDELRRALDHTRAFRQAFKLADPTLAPPYEEDFDKQFEAVLEIRPAVLSFVFGTLSRDHLREAQKRGLCVIGTATTPHEALELEASGVDALVLQGVEAGGHRGLFDAHAEDPNLATLELVRETKKRIKIPVLAAGGIMNAQDVKRALAAGAEAVQMGTAFLATREAGTSSPYRQRLLASERHTRLTRAFSGRLARGIVNRFMEEMDEAPEAILPFPAQNKFTRDLRQASAQAESPDFLSLWCGTGGGELWTGSARELIERLFA